MPPQPGSNGSSAALPLPDAAGNGQEAVGDWPVSDAAVNSPDGDPAVNSPGRPEPASLTIGELEAGYSLYCKALRLLIQEGRSLPRIQRTVCWQRLAKLHACLPGQYKDPEHLYFQLRRSHAAT